MNRDATYMMRCLNLAVQGLAKVHPNPLVGCVLVKKGKIVGEGYHRQFGGHHAEVMAIAVAGRRAKGSTLYVNLEPCAHHGKTPPCVDLIIQSGIRRVVTASADPNPLVSGRGIRKLRSAGVKVSTGIMKKEAREMNERFFTFMKTGLPFVGLKSAQTLDGRIADPRGVSRWITSPDGRRYGHLLRSIYDAVLVGAETIRKDNPGLTVRHVKGRNPTRVILDGRFSISARARVFRDRASRTIVLTSTQSLRKNRRKAVLLERKGVEVLGIARKPILQARDILKVLKSCGISSVLLEGGAKVFSTFLNSRLVNTVHCIMSPKVLGSGLTGLDWTNLHLDRSMVLKEVRAAQIGTDILIEGKLQ